MQLINLFNPFNYFKSNLTEIADNINFQEKTGGIRNNTVYNGIIISLYGFFERFIDELASKYLEFLLFCSAREDAFESIEKAKQQIENMYKANLCDFLINPKRHSNIDSSYENVNQILSSYINIRINRDYSHINKDLLLIHGGNIRSDVLFTFFKNLQVQNMQFSICDCGPFKDFLMSELGFDEVVIGQLKSQTNSDLYLQLNRLVDERNIVAHTGKSENKISFNEILNKTIPFLLVFADAISRSLIEFVYKNLIVDTKFRFTNESIFKAFDNCILCHENESFIIEKGDYFVIQTKDDFFITKILTIQLNNKDILNTSILNQIYGFKVDRRIKSEDKVICVI